MVVLYIGGKQVGTLADAETILSDSLRHHVPVDLRTEAGELVGRFTPVGPIAPTEPLVPWDPTITREELDRRAAEPGLTLDEVRRRLGWA